MISSIKSYSVGLLQPTQRDDGGQHKEDNVSP